MQDFWGLDPVYVFGVVFSEGQKENLQFSKARIFAVIFQTCIKTNKTLETYCEY